MSTVALYTVVKGLAAPIKLLVSKIECLPRERRSGGLHGDLVWETGHL